MGKEQATQEFEAAGLSRAAAAAVGSTTTVRAPQATTEAPSLAVKAKRGLTRRT